MTKFMYVNLHRILHQVQNSRWACINRVSARPIKYIALCSRALHIWKAADEEVCEWKIRNCHWLYFINTSLVCNYIWQFYILWTHPQYRNKACLQWRYNRPGSRKKWLSRRSITMSYLSLYCTRRATAKASTKRLGAYWRAFCVRAWNLQILYVDDPHWWWGMERYRVSHQHSSS